MLLIFSCSVAVWGLCRISITPETTTAAQRFQGESEIRFAQIACFLPVGAGKTQEEIYDFRLALENKFVEESLEAPEGGSLWIDAYSGSTSVHAVTEHGRVEMTAIGVGGDFFHFHPLRLRSGAYISERDLMDDLVLLDEVTAWRLFGGFDLAGMPLEINGNPFVVAGVVTLEDDFASKRAMQQEGGIFLSYSALERLNEELAIDCYEIVLPDPISGYAAGVVETLFAQKTGEVVENSGRYAAMRLLDVVRSFGARSMHTSAVVYPYWENALRLREDYAAVLLMLAVLLAVCPAVSAAVCVIRLFRAGVSTVRRAVPAWAEHRIEQYREKKLAAKKTEEE
ncbi:MAG: ABC transporter permease [Oscillospiraceae bacterium]|nr:ABC transporter permease [Oscillospiraceae bacterium]